jgi:hypothetical protein
MSTSNAVAELDLAELAGRSTQQARSIVEAAGGRVRVIAPGGLVTMEYVPNRITLTVVDDVVTQALGPG